MKKYNNPKLKKLRSKLRKSSTDQERIIWNLLRNRKLQGLKFFRQYSIETYILDFYCPEMRLSIEIDGGQHNESANKANNEKRTEYLNLHNITVIRFWNNEITSNLDGVYEKIIQTIKIITPPNLLLS